MLFDSVKFAILSSLDLVKQGNVDGALRLLDDTIEQAERDHKDTWVVTLCHHAANIARHLERQDLAQSYYERSLRANPTNPRALYGLAVIALDRGDRETAREYASRCYAELANRDDDDVMREGLLPLVVKHWPEIASV